MCGIVGKVSKSEFFLKDMIRILKKVDYRGYDSFGICDDENNIQKFVGEIDENKIEDKKSNISISHTRWATHGKVSIENAHPHKAGDTVVVHNGVISNFKELQEEFLSLGKKFISDTDTELIAHFFDGKNVKDSMQEFFKKFKGEFSVILKKENDDKLYAFKRKSPLSIGILDDGFIIASDIYAFENYTKNVIFFNENEFAIIDSESYKFYSVFDDLKPVEKKIENVEISLSSEIGEYSHFMKKEIYEQPSAVNRFLDSIKNDQNEKINEFKNLIEESKRIVFIASGTSYHAALIGVLIFNKLGIESHAILSSEFRNFVLYDDKTLVIPLSQSGETMDLINALNGIKSKGVKIASIINVPYSTIQRMSNVSIDMVAGKEVAVASTKSFTNQIISLLYIASEFGYRFDFKSLVEDMNKILSMEDKIIEIANKYLNDKNMFIIGRNMCYPISREIALKIKEISYIHAEGMMAGEFKHGTLALIENNTPVISLIPKNDLEIITSSKEIESRGANIIEFSEEKNFKNGIIMDFSSDESFAICASIFGQLLSFHIAKLKNLPIDKPRNLAKSVTVR